MAPAMNQHFHFSDLRELLAKANEEKSGDQLAGIAAVSERERVAAKSALADVPLIDLLNNPVIPPETDEVSRLILESHDSSAFQPIRSMTVGSFREFLLDNQTTEAELKSLKWGITPEMAAAVAKLMSNKDLVLAARKFATSLAAATPWASAACSASACSRTIRPTTSAAFCLPRSKACSTAAATPSSA